MKRVQFITTSVSLAFLVSACSSEPTPDGTPQSPTGGSNSANAGGNSSGPVGGTKADPTSNGSQTGPMGGNTYAGGSKSTSAGPVGGSSEGGTSNRSGTTTTGAVGNTVASGGSAVGGVGGVNATGGKVNSGGAGSTASDVVFASGGKGTGIGGGTNSGGTNSGGTKTDSSSGGSKGGDSATGGASTNTTPTLTEVKVITSGNNAFWKEATFTESSGTATVTVNDGSALQNWSGFGGTFNEKGWSYLTQLPAADQEKALKLLFDKADGANFVLGRIPIGASDYAMDRYTLNENKGDYEMAKFSIARDKEKLIPYIKAAQKVRSDIFFWGSPWTPPTWLKDNGAFDRGNMKSDAQTLTAYALYLAKFVQEYEKEGITVKAVHPQNEPGYGQDYPSCLWSGATMASFIGKYLGPKFKELSLGAEIWCGTMSNKDADGAVLTSVMNDATAKGFVKGVGLQWTMIDSSAGTGGLPVWQTEHKCGNYPWDTGTYKQTAPNDWAYGVESWGLIRDWIKNKKVNAYSAWNMVLDTVGKSLDTVRPWAQNALLTVDTGSKKLNITPTYYVFRHLSQYVEPGAKVVATSGGDALAFKNADGSVVAVLYSSSGGNQVVSAGGKKISFSMSGGGWATVVVPKS